MITTNLKFIKTLTAGFMLAIASCPQTFAGENIIFSNMQERLSNNTLAKLWLIKAVRGNGNSDCSKTDSCFVALKEAKDFVTSHCENDLCTVDIDDLKSEFPNVDWNINEIKQSMLTNGYNESWLQYHPALTRTSYTPSEAAEAIKQKPNGQKLNTIKFTFK